ncbi:hypothetical protein HNY73_009293 [Argiope bruennichi]|uniref:Uncharacterized protein n=1 Tax=Argiope bruennichi TaxID=94029 RepID=A0A8T0FBQ0_ARGBR|nr:hypothetical protein HNY73_009293 [Argiope bruennichi]
MSHYLKNAPYRLHPGINKIAIFCAVLAAAHASLAGSYVWGVAAPAVAAAPVYGKALVAAPAVAAPVYGKAFVAAPAVATISAQKTALGPVVSAAPVVAAVPFPVATPYVAAPYAYSTGLVARPSLAAPLVGAPYGLGVGKLGYSLGKAI